MFVDLPLLAGESVTTEGVRVENGHVRVSLPANVRQARWRSLLEPSERIELTTHHPADFANTFMIHRPAADIDGLGEKLDRIVYIGVDPRRDRCSP